MAWEYITATCGHEYREQMYGKQSGRDSRVEYLSRRECPDCYQAAKDKAHADQTSKASAVAQAQGLPTLTGSDKQIAWAITLRDKALATIRTMVDPTSTPQAPMAYATLKLYADKITREETGAKYWIDTRDRDARAWRNKALEIAARACGLWDDTKDALTNLRAMTPDQVQSIGEWAIRETSMVEVVSPAEAVA